MNRNAVFALRRRFLKVLATTAAVWGVGAQAQQAKDLPASEDLRRAATAHRLPEGQRSTCSRGAARSRSALRRRRRGQLDRVPGRAPQLEALAVGSLDFGDAATRRRCSRRPPASTCLRRRRAARSRDSSAILVPADSPIRDAGRPKGKRSRCSKGIERALPAGASAARRPACTGATSTPSTWRRPMRAPPSRRARSTPGRSGTRYYAAAELDAQAARARRRRGLSGNNSLLPRLARPCASSTRGVLQALFEELTAADAYGAVEPQGSGAADRRVRRPAAWRPCTASSRAAPPSPVGPLTPALSPSSSRSPTPSRAGADSASRSASPTSSGTPARRSRTRADRFHRDDRT